MITKKDKEYINDQLNDLAKESTKATISNFWFTSRISILLTVGIVFVGISIYDTNFKHSGEHLENLSCETINYSSYAFAFVHDLQDFNGSLNCILETQDYGNDYIWFVINGSCVNNPKEITFKKINSFSQSCKEVWVKDK